MQRTERVLWPGESRASLQSVWADIPPPAFPIPLQQIAVPETLLKKRKSTDKTREEKLAKAAEAKKVRRPFTTNEQGWSRDVSQGREGTGKGLQRCISLSMRQNYRLVLHDDGSKVNHLSGLRILCFTP